MASYWVVVFWIVLPLALVFKIVRSRAGWQFIFKGRDIMMTMANRHGDAAFSVPIPGNRLHLFTSKQHWDDLNSTSLTVLSNHAWSKDFLQPGHAFGYDWPDRRNEEGMPIVRAIRTISNQFSLLRSTALSMMQRDYENAIKAGSKTGDLAQVPLWQTLQFSLTRVNTMMIYGEDVANNPEFMTRCVNFLDEAGKVAEAVKTLPPVVSTLVKKLIQGRNLNRDYVYQSVAKKVEQFRAAKAANKDTRGMPKTVLNAFMEFVPDEWSTTRVVHIVNTLWYSATHAITVLAAHLIQDIYAHPSYIPALLDECKNVLGDPDSDLSKLPLLEAFLMESMRTKCFQSTTIHRMALDKQFIFSDGYTVPPGEILSFLQHAVYADDRVYPDAQRFDPMRFYDTGKSASDMPGREWAFWGNSKLACPGRFIFSNVAKLLAIYLLTNFDAKLEDYEGLNFTFRDAAVPSSNVTLLMEKRET